YSDNAEIAHQYAMVLVNLSAVQMDLESRQSTVDLVESIYKSYSDNAEIAHQYAMVLVNLSAVQMDLESRQSTVDLVESIYKSYPDNAEIARQYAMVLANLSGVQTDLESRQSTVDLVKSVYESHSDNAEIALYYAGVLVNLSAVQTDLESSQSTVDLVKSVYESHSDNAEIALYYAMVLANLSAVQMDLESCQSTVDLVESIYKSYPDNAEIARQYAMVLANLSVVQTDLESRQSTVDLVKSVYESHSDNAEIALYYAGVLVNLSAVQTDLESRQSTVDLVESIYKSYPDNAEIAHQYAIVLRNLSVSQTEEDDIEKTKRELEAIYSKYGIEEIAVQYAVVLRRFCEVTKSDKEKSKLIDLLTTFSNNSILDILFEVARENFPIEEEEHKVKLKGNIERILDKSFFSEDSSDSGELSELEIKILEFDFISQTKYRILKEAKGKVTSENFKKLVEIYKKVQKIKYELAFKGFKTEGAEFGHYTSGKVLQILLKQDTNEGYKISGKTRLNNANYMNDPEEGIVLEKILGVAERDPLEPSSWFLMSFTKQIDDLAMWSQYGCDAEGVCIVLREDDFSLMKSKEDLNWSISEKAISTDVVSSESRSKRERNVLQQTTTVSNQEVNKDYLYRIAYVNYSTSKLNIRDNALFEKEEIDRLNTLLGDLQKLVADKSGDSIYNTVVSECIEEIRYLFKSMDYKYEEELRILKYARLESESKSIKVDNGTGIGKLYLERDEVVKIKKIIFGPKFQNPEYITPLIKLLDKDIKFKKSEKRFR
ncbi:DUF2971 domain-containing protein, partial [Streptococcus saliviloxodontae]